MDDEAIDFRGMVGLLRRRIRLVVLTTVVVLGASSLALLAVKPIYSATTLIFVDPSKKNLLDDDWRYSGGGGESIRVDSEVELVKSDTTLRGVARDMNLAADAEFGSRPGVLEPILAYFRPTDPQLPGDGEAASLRALSDAVTVQRRGLTFLIAVTARSSRPDFAAALANAVAATYVRQQHAAKVASASEALDLLKARLPEAGAAVARADSALDAYIGTNIGRISQAAGRPDVAQMWRAMSQGASERTQSIAVVDLAEGWLLAGDWTSLADHLKNETIAVVEKQHRDLAARLAGTSAHSAAALDVRARLAALEAALIEAGTMAVNSLREQLAASPAELTAQRGRLRAAILGGDLPSDLGTGIYTLQQEGEYARGQYQRLLAKQVELETQTVLQLSDSRIASPAMPPHEPSFPSPRLFLLFAGLAGLGLGVGLAVLIENFVGGFVSEEQMAALLRAPVVAAVPRRRAVRREEGGEASAADAVVISPLSEFAEAVRRVRVGVDLALQRRRQSVGAGDEARGMVIVVTSAVPNEGKSMLALALSRAYALAGIATLLIDCDLRKPSVHKHLGVAPSEGLLELLRSNDADARAITTVDRMSDARVILGSRRSDIATDQFVTGKTFERLIDAARRAVEVVVLDTPPVGSVVDGLYLAGMADAIVMLVKYSSTPQQAVRAAAAALASAKAEVTPLLLVLNQHTISTAANRSPYAGYYDDA